jgi:mannose-6-phosphate isomerase-like protein (cupin superfamily)
MKMNLPGSGSSREIFEAVAAFLKRLNLDPQSQDLERPWGGFFTFGEERAPDFQGMFFPELSREILSRSGRLSPKILMVEPRKKLSWQYHHRRSEIWKSLHGNVGVFVSATNLPGPLIALKDDNTIQIAQGQRHRLVGLETWGVIAEIWLHTDPHVPSDENDIVRLEDDFGR